MEIHSTLRIFWICGLVSVLVDLDHVASLILWATKYPTLDEGRIFHSLLLTCACVFICCLGSHIRGLLVKLVLVGVIIITILTALYASNSFWGLG